MAGKVASNIIRDGLLLYYDAANPRSYPGSGNTWFDLSRNQNHGTLISGSSYSPTNKGCIVFDGIDDYVQFSTVSVQTICFWGNIAPGINNLAGLVCTGANVDGALRLNTNAPTPNFRNPEDNNGFQWQFESSFMISGNTGVYSVPYNADFYIGAIGFARNISTISHTFMSRVFKGNVYAVLLYNRQLTQNELLSNYITLKGRYGL